MSCEAENGQETSNVGDWEEILQEARGSSLTLMMWQGDPFINQYMNDFVVPKLKLEYGIELEISSGQGNQVVSTLMAEMEAGVSESEIDLMWINGETFFQLRQIDGLYGPFTEQLPHSRFINFDDPFIGIDFQQEVNGYECPWGNVQLALIYNSENVPEPPGDLEALKEWCKEHPGRFTIGNDFTGMTLLKSWLIHFAGGPQALAGEFDPQKYDLAAGKLWNFVREIQPYLWKEGKTFPNSVAQMHQLYANGELDFTMSNNDAEVDNKVQQGLFQESSRAYVPDYGTIQNSHYMGISKLSGNIPAAMVVCNFLISPEAQLYKMRPDVWGDGTILDMDKLDQEWRDKFMQVPGRKFAPPREEIKKRALQEPAPEYMIKLFEEFRTQVIEYEAAS